MRRLLILTALLALAGCSAAAQTKIEQARAEIQQITLTDADAAILIAQNANDPDGVACATAIKANLAAFGPKPLPKGILSTYMAARELHRSVNAGVPAAVHTACAPLIVDAEKLAIQLGLAVVPGGSLLPKLGQ